MYTYYLVKLRRMPPVQKQSLVNYAFIQITEEFESLWDPSQLWNLLLDGPGMIKTLKRLPTKQIANLQVLTIYGPSPSQRESIPALKYQSIVGELIEKLKSLEVIELSLCWPISSRALCERGGGELRRDRDQLLDVLGSAQSLRTVTIHACLEVFSDLRSLTETYDPGFDVMQKATESIHAKRCGTSFQMVTVLMEDDSDLVCQSRVDQEGVLQVSVLRDTRSWSIESPTPASGCWSGPQHQ
ncbi:hypothetical protein ONS95_008513 [Cadophora gregata]|uniref:uncharacterized protein n=1 Tax=Cadophora gregata TaxID=51156 RepID=UPI0026DB2065|nr:uncharacterized protein ONS95_008513 [Cadophora gregata]KAK0100175.1 hypothetical protein ONS95_008513 [Cadophora gregata]